ncbi:hypothetical protein Ddye_012754 [Dipteronia dyeriana]|uniref:Uncharacterized protein n=1 Tax=Dipteronia dyeriana TaxID=168575 RepID=A0AAD9X5B5_9ROSI|nr:hypothetical protein Ddye_012754 [Dipteronia dyeriana]
MSTKRSSSYTNAKDTHLCHIYLDVSQNPIIDIYQTRDMFRTRVETDYNNNRPSFITELRNKQSLQCHMQTILTTIGTMQGCKRQIESLKPSGASKADILDVDSGFLPVMVESDATTVVRIINSGVSPCLDIGLVTHDIIRPWAHGFLFP